MGKPHEEKAGGEGQFKVCKEREGRLKEKGN